MRGAPRVPRHLAVLLAVAVATGPLVALTSRAGAAAAHAGGLSPTNVRSTVTAVVPAVPGLVVETVEGGARLRVVNGTRLPLDVGAGGGRAAPERVAASEERVWVDTRATALDRPYTATAGDSAEWRVDGRLGDRRVRVEGRLEWQRPPAGGWAWWLVLGALAVGLPLAGALTGRRAAVVAAGTALVVASAVAHLAGSVAAVSTGPAVLVGLGAAGIGLAAWPLGVLAVLPAARGRPWALLGACVSATLTAVLVLPDVTAFHHALVPFAGPAALDRALVAATLGGGLGTAVAAVGALRALDAGGDDGAAA